MATEDQLRVLDLPDYERQIEHHEKAIRDLCETAIRTDAALAMPGAQAKRWLTTRGYTDQEAGRLIIRAVTEKREAKERDAEGTDPA